VLLLLQPLLPLCEGRLRQLAMLLPDHLLFPATAASITGEAAVSIQHHQGCKRRKLHRLLPLLSGSSTKT
jgi:hypothetical protein